MDNDVKEQDQLDLPEPEKVQARPENEETVEGEGAEQQQPEKEEKVEGEPEKPEAEVAASEEEKADWREKQINKQHARIQNYKTELADKEKKIAELTAMLQTPKAEGEKQIELPAQQRQQPRNEDVRSQVEFELRLEALNKAGEEAYKDGWNKALNRLVQIGDGTMPDLPWIAKALDKDAPKVIHALGMNPSEAMRISELPPERRQAEYFKLAMKEAPKPNKPSAAPAPVDPVKPRSQPTKTLSDEMSDDDWHALRAEQRKAHRAQRGMR